MMATPDLWDGIEIFYWFDDFVLFSFISFRWLAISFIHPFGTLVLVCHSCASALPSLLAWYSYKRASSITPPLIPHVLSLAPEATSTLQLLCCWWYIPHSTLQPGA
jgi:hypothetical protein